MRPQAGAALLAGDALHLHDVVEEAITLPVKMTVVGVTMIDGIARIGLEPLMIGVSGCNSSMENIVTNMVQQRPGPRS